MKTRQTTLEGRVPRVPIKTNTRVPIQREKAGRGCPTPPISGSSCIGCGGIGDPRPALRNEFGFWELMWNGERAVLRCEPGAAYVSWLLENRPSQPVTALELAAKVTDVTCPCFGSAQVFHPTVAAAIFFWLRKQHELEILVDCEDTLDPVKEEALRELEAIYAWQRRHPNRANCDAETAARMVTAAIENFWRNLARARTLRGEPHQLARAFAKYLHEHVVEPSRMRAADGFWRVI